MRVHFTREQIEYLMKKLGSDDSQEVMQTFMDMLGEEGIDPSQAPMFLKRLMLRDEAR